jgi:hypothetical protein
MITILKIAGVIFKAFGSLLTDEFFWIIICILILLYKRSDHLETGMLGKSFPLIKKVSGSLLVGAVGGLLGSLMGFFVGISVDDYTQTGAGSLAEGIVYIWIIAILLSMINPRYLCFSYAGGLVAFSSLLIGFPPVNVPGLLSLIGILHLIESFLIWFDGHTYSVPVFLKRKDGGLVGGYIMNRIWPIPLIVFAVLFGDNSGGANIAGIVNMPSWWPLLKHSAAGGTRELLYLPVALPVVLGYGDMAISKCPEERCSSSAKRLAVYSIILILLSVLASKMKAFAYIAALFAPLAHELLILYGAKEEEEGKPLFADRGIGVSVLYTVKGSPADLMGIEAGDVIVSFNGVTLYDDKQLSSYLAGYPPYIWLDIRKPGGSRKTVEHKDYRTGIGSLGALIIPKNIDRYYEINKGSSIFKSLLKYLRNKKNRDIEM